MPNLDYKLHYRRNLPHLQPPGATLFVTFRLAGSIPRAVLDEWARQKVQFQSQLAQLAGLDERKRREHEFQRQRFAHLEKYLDKADTGPSWLAEVQIAQLLADSMRYRDGKVYSLEAYCIMANHVHAVITPLPVAQAASLCHDQPLPVAQAASLCHDQPLPVAQAASLCHDQPLPVAQAASLCHDQPLPVAQAASLCHDQPLPVAQAASLCHDQPLPVAQAASLCHDQRFHSLASIMHSLKGYTAREGNRLLGRTGDFWEHESYDHYVRDEEELERIILYVLSNPLKAGLVADWKAWPWSYCRVAL